MVEKDPNSPIWIAERVRGYYICNCRRKNIFFELTAEEMKELIFQNCFYCGKSPSNKGRGNIPYGGIDRLDTNKGYSVKNCVPCCIECNGIKSNKYTPEETKAMVDALGITRARKSK